MQKNFENKFAEYQESVEVQWGRCLEEQLKKMTKDPDDAEAPVWHDMSTPKRDNKEKKPKGEEDSSDEEDRKGSDAEDNDNKGKGEKPCRHCAHVDELMKEMALMEDRFRCHCKEVQDLKDSQVEM